MMKLSDLPSSQLYIIQGNAAADIVDLPDSVHWFNWKDKNFLSNQLIVEKSMQKFVNIMEKQGIFDSSIVKSLNILAKTVELTQVYLNNLPDALKSFREVEEFIDFINLYNEQTKLKQELHWANYLESQSKTNVGLKRIQRLDSEIAALQKKKQIFEPQYEFLKESDTQIKQTLKSLNNEAKRVNKIYISKTSQINKLKRKIDVEKPKSDLYAEKLEELAVQISKSKLSDNEDYQRISKKSEKTKRAISQYEEEIAFISEDITQDKTHIKETKKKLRELKQNNAQTSSNFLEIQKSYMEITSQLKKSTEEKANLVKSQTKDNASTDLGVPPTNIRFSSIIEDELNSNTIQLSRYISKSETTPEAYISQYFKSRGLSKKKFNALVTHAENLPETSLRQFQTVLESIEDSLNSVLNHVGLKITFTKLPLIEQLENSLPQYGIQFQIHKNKKPIKFEKLPPEEKFYVMCSFEYTLNNIAGIRTHVFVDLDFKIKRTKSLIEKTIRLIKSGLMLKEPNQRIVIFLSKLILEETTQKDMIITTLTSK
ncbi:MAG: hypothetical protein ACTSRE_05580 [Promethearchaeota archaeon]